LPPELRWVDIYLPGILNYKTEALRDEKPVCRYEAITADLTDVPARQTLFARLGATATQALLVTEGLLVYLQSEQVAELAKDLHAQPSFTKWLIDLASPKLLQRMKRIWGKQLESSGSPFVFGPKEGTAFFQPYGWREAQYRSTWEESLRLNRTMKGARFWNLLGRLYPKKMREEFKRFSGTVLLERE